MSIDPTTDAIAAITAELNRLRHEVMLFNNESDRIHGLLDDMNVPKADADVHSSSKIENRLRKMWGNQATRAVEPVHHNVMFRTGRDYGLSMLGCSCGFRCTSADPDSEMSLHLSLVPLAELPDPARTAYDQVRARFGDGGTHDERQALFWRVLKGEKTKFDVRSKNEDVRAAVDRISRGSLGQLYLTVSKPWGSEKIWARTDKYVGKILTIQSGQSLSLQYHREKSETIMVLTGGVLFTYGDVDGGLKSRTVGPNEPIDIPPGLIHRMHATELTTALEVSTPELDDVVRLEDRYGRTGPDRHDT